MSVKLIDNNAFYGYRVRRTVDGKLYQEYLTLNKGGKRMGKVLQNRVKAIAEARDDELIDLQKEAKQARKAEKSFRADGSVRGISYLIKKEQNGNLTPIFQMGMASEVDGKIICTSYSINAHGVKGAWNKVVDGYIHHKNIKKNSALHRKIKKAVPDVKLPVNKGKKTARTKNIKAKVKASKAA